MQFQVFQHKEIGKTLAHKNKNTNISTQKSKSFRAYLL